MAVCPEPRHGRKAGRDPGERTPPSFWGLGTPPNSCDWLQWVSLPLNLGFPTSEMAPADGEAPA